MRAAVCDSVRDAHRCSSVTGDGLCSCPPVAIPLSRTVLGMESVVAEQCRASLGLIFHPFLLKMKPDGPGPTRSPLCQCVQTDLARASFLCLLSYPCYPPFNVRNLKALLPPSLPTSIPSLHLGFLLPLFLGPSSFSSIGKAGVQQLEPVEPRYVPAGHAAQYQAPAERIYLK
jgi:hypothetical protein